VANQTTWRTDILRVEVPQPPALSHGWTEYLKQGNVSISFKATEVIPNQVFAMELEGSTGFHGKWRGELIPSNGGTLLKAKETIITESWLGKWIGLFVSLEATMNLYMDDLERALAKQ
jgi:hypothetical protein